MAIPHFSGAAIDRADHVRSKADLLSAALADRRAKLLDIDGLDPAVENAALRWTSLAELTGNAEPLFLGNIDGIPAFAPLPHDVSHIDGRSRSCWTALMQLSSEQAALYAGARSLIAWHAAHRFCANCGAPTDVAKAGWARICGICSAEHFPRTDPVAIMLAEHRDDHGTARVLVGHGVGFPDGRMSALAGFIEPGESLEEGVRRELKEEAGIVAGNVRYVASQPWPFPSSLMIGCIAQVANPALTLDTTEVDEAIWVSVAEVEAALAGDSAASFIAPPPIAIARNLLETWVEQETKA